jgi:hypothetical protein
MNDMPWIKSYPAGVRWDINITPLKPSRNGLIGPQSSSWASE